MNFTFLIFVEKGLAGAVLLGSRFGLFPGQQFVNHYEIKTRNICLLCINLQPSFLYTSRRFVIEKTKRFMTAGKDDE